VARKTFNAAAVVLWALARWPESLVITTAPTFRQVKVLWNEIGEARKRKRSRVAFPEPSATELKLADKRYAVGLSTNDPNKFQSYHAAHVLIIADEAQSILRAIWEAVEGIRAGGDVRVCIRFFKHFQHDMLGGERRVHAQIKTSNTYRRFDVANGAGWIRSRAAKNHRATQSSASAIGRPCCHDGRIPTDGEEETSSEPGSPKENRFGNPSSLGHLSEGEGGGQIVQLQRRSPLSGESLL
jgi:hypothetical protein